MKILINSLKIFATWRFILFIAVLLVVPLSNSFGVFGNFDGKQFINIAREGYGTPNTYYSYFLFPLYPVLIKLLSSSFGFLASGLIISHLLTVGCIYLFYKLARLDYSVKSAKLATFLLLIFPSSFYLISVYSESLFLFLCLASVYLSRKKLFFFSAILAALACYTRLAGLFLWLVLIVEYYQYYKTQVTKRISILSLSLLIPPLGTIYYLNYLHINSSIIQRLILTLPSKFVFLHQVIFRYLKMLTFVDHSSSLFLVVLTESLIGFFAIYVLFISYKNLRTSYWIYFFLSFFVPTLWGNFVGMPRYLLVVFPMFFFLGEWLEKQHPYIQNFYKIISIALLFINLTLFISGVFVG